MEHPQKPRRFAVIGFGKLGCACGDVILGNEALKLAGFVRRSETVHKPLPDRFRGVRTTSDIATLGRIDAALLCLPAAITGAAAYELLQHRIAIVECASRPGGELQDERKKLHQLALRHGISAVSGAGWDPGALSLFHRLFALLIPKGHTETTDRPGVSLHHAPETALIEGVRDALWTEVRSVEGKVQRYVYVELVPGAEPERVGRLIRSDPCLLNVETLVFPVDSVAALEQQGHGLVVMRRGSSATGDHRMLMLEARFDVTALAAQVMVAAARALRWMPPGLHSLPDLPLTFLCPEALRI